MTEQENWKIQARKRLIDAVLNEIDLEKPPTEVYLDIFYSVAKLGLLMKAKKAGLFEKEAWQKNENLTNLMKAIEAFLWKEIK